MHIKELIDNGRYLNTVLYRFIDTFDIFFQKGNGVDIVYYEMRHKLILHLWSGVSNESLLTVADLTGSMCRQIAHLGENAPAKNASRALKRKFVTKFLMF